MDSLEFLKSIPDLKITISGDIGSGKSTFAKRLAAELNIERIYIGGLMREEAAKRGMTLDEFGVWQLTDPSVDKMMDNLTREKARELGTGIFEGRTSWHFVENPTVKVFFKVDPRVAAERVWQADDESRDKYHSIEEVIQANAERKAVEIERFKQYYNLDIYDQKNFDVVIDSTNKSIDETYRAALSAIVETIERQRS